MWCGVVWMGRSVGRSGSAGLRAGLKRFKSFHKPIHQNPTTQPTDSIGCIMGELLIERPLFRADTDLAQLEAIFKVPDAIFLHICV